MRRELLALTPESLAALTNRGLVKRATRDLERSAPTMEENGQGTLTATYADGVTTTLPAGGLEAGRCSCGATGVCRHVVMLVLAYAASVDPGSRDAGTGDAGARAAAAEAAGRKTDGIVHRGDGLAGTKGSGPGVGGDSELSAGSDGQMPGPGSSVAEDGGLSSVAPADLRREPGSGGETRAGNDSASATETVAASGPSEAEHRAETGAASDSVPGSPSDAPVGGLVHPPRHPSWTPAVFTDAELEAHIGKRAMNTARRALAKGYVARVRRASAADPVPGVDLPAATVRFHVPGDLGFARSDAVAGTRDDVVALAVWAFRAADEQAPDQPEPHVQVGGAAAGDGGSALEQAVELATTVLQEGAVHLETGLVTRTSTVRAALDGAKLRWPLLALEDLDAQLQAYRDRSARYRPDALADHIAELFARYRAVTNGGSGLRSRVLGTDEASQTHLRRARLEGLGARVTAAGDERTVEVFLAHADSASVLVMRRTYTTNDTGSQLGARRVAGATIQRLASGAVITDAARRSANRTVTIGAGGLSRTQAMTVSRPWQHLPAAIAPPSLTVLAGELDELPPRLVRARVKAELVRVIPVTEVEWVAYSPGDQRLDAVVTDADGTRAMISATHDSWAPGRLDAMAAALGDGLRQVSGTVRRSGGGIVIDPIGFALDDEVIVPDLTPATHTQNPDPGAPGGRDVLHQVLDDASALLTQMAHRGIHHLPNTVPARLTTAAAALRRVGLHLVADDVEQLGAGLGPEPGPAVIESWVNAYLRVSLARDLHQG
ncbi:hypothetical protein [Kineosporia sp. NBRC 101731]|uniref:hypothetical protein n=1 Tax=Kineosporia sp. NBRC 101731 TaxID=3032199 RepID=UPI0024A2F145|nr:hypothetical protein [Kineosporia sp. NBRC 101731]GLY32639.1 hypothetical protein Kisp02_60040 [Kineosporia sp. NBRC 101731]